MAQRTTRKFACQVEEVRKQLEQSPLAFSRILSWESVMDALRETGVTFRERIYTPWITLWAFLTQVMSADHSCRAAVFQVVSYMASQGQQICSPATSSYCEARARLPEQFYRYLMRRIGRQTADEAPASWLFHERPVKVVDGTTVTMPDTEANQKEYPQVSRQPQGLGFPIARLLVVFSLAVGTVLETAIRPYQGKGAGELSVFRELLDLFDPGDIVLGDKGFCSYGHLAWLLRRSVDSVVALHRSRLPNLQRLKTFSKNEALYRWNKPKEKPESFSAEEFAQLPDHIDVRIVTVVRRHPGFRSERTVIVTTLLDRETFSASEIGELFRRRWQCELFLRDIKTTLQMAHLRCETPEMVRKEIFTHLLAYNVIRTRMAQAAYHGAIAPHHISFKSTLQEMQNGAAYGGARTLLQEAVAHTVIARQRIGRQPGRYEPRQIKRRSKYAYLKEPRDIARNHCLVKYCALSE